MLLFTNKKDAQGSGAAVAGDGTACFTFDDGVKETAVFADGIFNSGQAFFGNGGIGQEKQIFFDVVTLGKTILHIAGQALGVVATILFDDAHLATLDFDTGLQVQQVGAQSSGGGATTTLCHVLELIQNEAGFHLGHICLDLFLQLCKRSAFLCQLSSLHHDVTLTGGKVH